MSKLKGYNNLAFQRDYIAALVQLRKQGKAYVRPDTGEHIVIFPSGINGERIDVQIAREQREQREKRNV